MLTMLTPTCVVFLPQLSEFPEELQDSVQYHTLCGLLTVIDRALQLVTLGHQIRTLPRQSYKIGDGAAECMSVLVFYLFFSPF